MRLCCTFVLIFSISITSAFAQDGLSGGQAVRPSGKLIISSRAIDAGMAAHPPAPAQPSSRDSLKNGAIIGAVIGGVAMGAAGTWVCSMLREPGDPPCWKSVLPVAAIFAGIGAAAGAGIDALAAREPRLYGPRSERSPQRLSGKDR
jgi:hypothetical protein